ncbi:unnamed protein product [Mytilus coruscus]|uniref:Uncharacterized protein n=1 Tax=Mytilus coruscus TaxID=42192 RepID=A0A6J8ARV3_MYTCO|nr:unnamed protein product [Mytilus coruscus]
MEREYRSFIEHKKKTGEGKKKQPEFFDELHKMLSVRHSVNPVAISDTTGSSSSLSVSSDKVVTPDKSSQRSEGTADPTSSLEPDCNNNNPNEKQSAACVTPSYKRKHSLKSEKNEEVINLIKTMYEENKRSEERRFEREIEFFDSLQKEIANQHKERMKATYDLIDALKNNN